MRARKPESTDDPITRMATALEGILQVLSEGQAEHSPGDRAARALERLADAGQGARTNEGRQDRKERAMVTMVKEEIRSIARLSERTGIPATTLRRWPDIRRYCGLDDKPQLDQDHLSDTTE